jgi:hypothetical protein
VGLLRWIRGEENSTSTAMLSAGLAEFAAIFQPTRHKQTEHIDESSRRRVDLGTGTSVDLDRGVAIIQLARGIRDEGSDRVGDELHGDRGQ